MCRSCSSLLILLLLVAGADAEGAGLGRVVTLEEAAPYDISIAPDGALLPVGSGTALIGRPIYEAKCLSCHGEKGAGKPHDQLVGGFGTLSGEQAAVKTVGSYWPYATTLFDYIRRAMPFNAPKSLTDDEAYSVTAYILALNGVVEEDFLLDAHSLRDVQMPNRGGFIPYSPGK